jgi:hypothetical protein
VAALMIGKLSGPKRAAVKLGRSAENGVGFIARFTEDADLVDRHSLDLGLFAC